MKWIRDSFNEWVQSFAPPVNTSAGRVLADLQSVDPAILQRLKRELVPFNARRKKWNCPRAKIKHVPPPSAAVLAAPSTGAESVEVGGNTDSQESKQ